MTTDTSDIFFISASAEDVVCPPDQVFRNEDFDFLITAGGHLVEDHIEYHVFMMLLKEIGEQEFTIRENLGATITSRTVPFQATFSSESTLDEFDRKIKEFDEHFGLTPWHWFVHGQKGTWGIYIAEYPTVNIIGCLPELTDKFRTVFRISDNGYDEESSFLDKEFELAKDSDMKRTFLDNYKMKTTHHNKT